MASLQRLYSSCHVGLLRAIALAGLAELVASCLLCVACVACAFCIAFLAPQAALQAQSGSGSATSLQYDDKGEWGFGIMGGGTANIHDARFFTLPRVQRSSKEEDFPFRSGFGVENSDVGVGSAIGVVVDIPFTRWFSLELQGSFLNRPGRLQTRPEPAVLGRLNGTSADDGVFQTNLQTTIATVGLDLLARINPFAGLNLYLGARLDLAAIKTFEQYETIVSPDDGVFFDTGRRTRKEQNGVLPDVRALGVANLNASIVGGLGYEVPVNAAQSLTLEAQVMVHYGLFSVIESFPADEYWRTHSARAGLSLRYFPAREAKYNGQDYQIKKLIALEQSIAQERSKIQDQLREIKQSGVLVKLGKPVGITPDGKEIANPTINVEQFQASNTVQMLNYIFFNDNSSVLPARYRRILSSERQNFTLERMAKLPTLEIYHNILNVVGKRMADNPSTTITLVGCNNATGAENNNRKLSRQRAESVSDYLQDVWKIPSNRIILKDRDLPEQPSNDTENGRAENRRVELVASSPLLLQPVAFESTFFTVNVPTIRFDMDISAGPGLKQWSLEISQVDGRESKTLKSVEGASSYPNPFVWAVDEDQARIPAASGTVDLRLDITDNTNRTADAPILSIPVVVVSVADKRSNRTAPKSPKSPNDERVDVVTFGVFNDDVAKSTSEPMTAVLLDAVKAKIKPGTRVVVEGYMDGEQTDGTLDNFLSKRRADYIAKALGEGKSGATIQAKTISKQQGNTTQKILLNDPTLPEGRFYNRSVRVEIHTPL
jgi:outer membrane protein OmpA-like peptidoglycan-associated protein